MCTIYPTLVQELMTTFNKIANVCIVVHSLQYAVIYCKPSDSQNAPVNR